MYLENILYLFDIYFLIYEKLVFCVVFTLLHLQQQNIKNNRRAKNSVYKCVYFAGEQFQTK